VKFAFPQDPTHAVSAMRRIDEAADTNAGQSDLERQQDIAVVGQTVPLIFCNRHEWGTDGLGQELGTNGGLWVSPRLIGLYPKALEANLLYLVSSGEVSGLSIENVYYGYDKLEDKISEDYIINENGQVEVDENGNPLTQTVYPYFAYAYEAIPPGIDSVYQPGGSDELHIPNIRPRDEFRLNGYNFTTNENCERLQILIDGDLWSDKTGTFVNPATRGSQSYTTQTCCQHNNVWQNHTCGAPQPGTPAGYSLTGQSGLSCSSWYNGNGYSGPRWNVRCCQSWTFTAGSWYNSNGPTVTVEFYTYAVYSIEIKSTTAGNDDPPAYLNAFTLRIDGRSSYALPPIDLEPDTYRVEIRKIEDGWDSAMTYLPISAGPSQDSQVIALTDERQTYTENGKSPGTGRIEADIQITETIYNRIEYPEIPGGGEQTSGTFFDLTLAGIRGSIRALKPVDGSGNDYWTQAHMFVEQGVLVTRLMPSLFPEADEEGASHFYADLIYYLLGKAQMIKEDQIDIESLRHACVIHEHYKIYYNGIMQLTSSFSEWLTRTAPYFLMTPRQVDGKYGVWPVAPVDANGEFSRDSVSSYLAMAITADDIVSGSYGRAYFPAKDRKDICLVMVYKDQPNNTPGQTVTIEVRYRGTALQGPFEQHDLTEFCCHPNQAMMSARYLLARRRYTTHSVELTMGRRGAQLQPGDVVSVDLAVNTTEGDGITDLNHYTVEAVTEGQGGQVQLVLIHFPTAVNDAGETISVIAREIHEGQVSVQ
jgi:hypothetical protein